VTLSVRRRAPAALAVAVVLTTAGCISPARTGDQYHAKAVTAVEAASSEVATVQLTVSQRLAGKIPGPYADEVVTSSESTLGSIGTAFGSVQPPSPASDRTRDDVAEVLSTAQDAATHARIAVRRNARGDYDDVLAELKKAAADLSTVDDQLRGRST
jgi:hypothetical protein